MYLRSILRNMLAGVAIAVAATASSATLPDGADAPVPHRRPATADAAAGGVDGEATRVAGLPELGPMLQPRDVARLKEGLDALADGSTIEARVIRESLPKGSLDRDILTWAIALDGGREVPSGEIADASRELSGWPGMDALRRNAEEALYREDPPPAAMVKAFGGTPPRTPEGLILLARAWLALGDRDAALAVLSPFWREEKLEARDEIAILAEFGSIIPAADHRYRMERMLYEDRISSAERVAALAGAKPLADAWSAVIRNETDAGSLLDAVPKARRDAGYDFARIRWLRRSGKYEEAAAAMLKAPRDAASLIDPDEWWRERRVLSREMIDLGDAATAYALAAGHSAATPAMTADAEFHAGWYALRGLGNAALAATHFERIAAIAQGSQSLSRAYYWLGRAAEKGGPGDADAYFRRAADYGTTFYGQLAAERLGRTTIEISSPQPSAGDRALFGSREAVRAIGRLEDAGYAWRAGILFQDLAQELTSPGELELLAAMAERQGNDFMALRVGKTAARRGIDIGALAHPLGAIPASARIDTAGKALAYAVARQESEFNVAAVSGAGALGLLQLMPGTARAMAEKTGLPYSKARLTTDAGYNATLGAAFLADQLDRFDGSYILTFIGYNAGPRRAREWIDRYGDPRGGRLDDVVDWIEHIPFTETRNYVQRVMENFEIYKMRLSGHFDIAGDLVNGR